MSSTGAPSVPPDVTLALVVAAPPAKAKIIAWDGRANKLREALCLHVGS